MKYKFCSHKRLHLYFLFNNYLILVFSINLTTIGGQIHTTLYRYLLNPVLETAFE